MKRQHSNHFIIPLHIIHKLDFCAIYTDCANVSTLPVNVQKLASKADAFDSCLSDLETTAGLEVGGGVALSKNTTRNQIRRNGANGGKNENGIEKIP